MLQWILERVSGTSMFTMSILIVADDRLVYLVLICVENELFPTSFLFTQQ